MYVDRKKDLTNPEPSVLFELFDTENPDVDVNIDAELVHRDYARYKSGLTPSTPATPTTDTTGELP